MTAMGLPLLLFLAQTQLVDIQDLTPREHRVSVFVLTAVGAEPWPDRLRTRDDAHWQDDEQTTWPAAAWILDARTRAVVWDIRSVDTHRESNGLRRFSGTVHLPAGTYEAHYASYAASTISFNGDLNLNIKDIIRMGRRAKYGGPYVESGVYRQFALAITGAGRSASPEDIAAARTAFTASAIASVVPDRNSSARKGFEITRPTAVEVYAIGELSMDEEFDYGWIINVDSNKRVWSMDYADTDPAGGAVKNRMAHETLQLKPGHYVAYFACDDSHSPDDWNNVPATDPEFWGLTLRVADPAARASVRPYEYEPVPQGQTIVSLIGIGDDEMRSAGFALRRPMDVHIYAIGEGFSDRMADYAWIVDEEQHKRIWSMSYENTAHAGGAAKNRLFDGTVHLAPGNYLVYYKSDGSHSGNDSTVAELTHMSNDEDARTTFSLTAQARLRVLALGEGRDDEMNDYGWIEDGAGRTVWTMKYADTEPAGGSDKNRVFDGVITLPAGSYVLRYRSDGSHSYGDWNANPPDDPESWGIAVFRMARR